MGKDMSFTYDVTYLVRLALQMFIDKHNQTEHDKSKILASNEMVYDYYTDDDIKAVLDKWAYGRSGTVNLFQNGLDDAAQMWELIWKSDEYKTILDKYICMGYGGVGVFDKTTRKFVKCNEGDHYSAIRDIIEDDYPELWEKHQAFMNNLTKDTQEVDEFIMTKLVLVGKFNDSDWYKLSERKY